MNLSLVKIAEKIKGLDLKAQYFILFGVAFFVILINYFVIIQFELGTIKKMNDSQLTLKNEIVRLEENAKRLNQLKADLKRYQGQLDAPQIKFRSKNDIPMLVEEYKKAAQTLGVQIEELIPVNESQELLLNNTKIKYWAVPLNFQARSGYHALGKWLNELERNRLLLNVKKLSITANESATNLHNIQAVLRVVVVE